MAEEPPRFSRQATPETGISPSTTEALGRTERVAVRRAPMPIQNPKGHLGIMR
jgi:hypothetical protein